MQVAPKDLPRHLAGQRPKALLLFGPDVGAVQETARALAGRWADAADPLSAVSFSAAELEADPGRLADEAAAISMFGGARVLRVDAATEGCTEALALLLDGPAGDPVILTAGDLKKTSKLRTLAEKHPAAVAAVHYLPTGRDAQRIFTDMAQARGLQPARDALARLESATGGNRALMAAELEKFALWLDATPENPQRLEPDHLAALGADSGEAEQGAFVAALLAGRGAALDRQLALLAGGPGAIPVLRAVGRQLQQLIRIRSAIDSGENALAAVKALRPPVFWKEQDALAELASRWPVPRLGAALHSVLAAERAIKTANGPGEIAGWQAMLRLAPAARRAGSPA